jgi:hypothetical protein
MEIPFKPTINKTSQAIINKKRSESDMYDISQGPENQKWSYRYFVVPEHKAKIKKSKAGKQEGMSSSAQQLCYHLYEEAKRRRDKAEKQANRIYSSLSQCWKIRQNSNSLITTARQNRIREVYRSLVVSPHQSLHHSQIDFNNLNPLQKIFMPIF